MPASFLNGVAQLARFGIEIDPEHEVGPNLTPLEIGTSKAQSKFPSAWTKIDDMLGERCEKLKIGLMSLPILVPYSDREILDDQHEGLYIESNYKANARGEQGVILIVYRDGKIEAAVALYETGEAGPGFDLFYEESAIPVDHRYS